MRTFRSALPNDLFHQIFHRCNSRDASVFVDKLLPALDFSAAFLSTVLNQFSFQA